MRILIAGGAGFIGRNFIEVLLQEPSKRFSKIFVIDKLTYASALEIGDPLWENPRIEFIHDSIQNLPNYLNDLPKFDFAINFAAESHVDRSIRNYRIFIENNIEGAASFFDSCFQLDIPKIIQISTDEVYGSIEEGEATTQSILLPNSPYSASKAAADLIGRAFNETYEKRIIVTRCTNNYGIYQNPEKFIPMAVCSLLSNKKITVYGNGLNTREWIHVRDHISGILKVLEFGKVGEIYNFGSGFRISNLELAQEICKLMGFTNEKIEFVPDRQGHDFRYAVDYSTSEIELNYKPQVNFHEGLNDLINWYAQNSFWWQKRLT